MLFDISFPICNYLIMRNYGFNYIEYKMQSEAMRFGIPTLYVFKRQVWVRAVEKVSINDHHSRL